MSTTHIQRWPVEVSIIIPVFNKADLTEKCLESLALTTRGVSHEVIVVDNASTDSTPQLLASHKPVRGIRNEVNRGFAGACNQGAAAARGQHLLFLNNDTIPFPGWLEPLTQEFRQHPEVAVVGSKLLYASGLVQHAGVAFARETRSPFHPHRCLQSDDPRVNRRREMQAVTAACMLIRREWFERCGRFNEEYRNGYEDLDLCLSIRRQGGIIVYQPKSMVYHLESQTPGRMKFDDVNRALFFSKWADWLLADEDAYYLADDYKMIYREEEGRKVGRLVRITSDTDRQAWKVVAQAQRLAAEGKWNDVLALLENAEAWPNDAAVRRWAAAICFRLNQPAAGNVHLHRSLELEISPEALLQLAQSESTATLPVAGSDGLSAGVSSQVKGVHAFLKGDYAQACSAFEEALAQGAHAREALFGMAAAALKTGDLTTTRQCCEALLAQRKADPLAKRLLEQLAGTQTVVSAPEAEANGQATTADVQPQTGMNQDKMDSDPGIPAPSIRVRPCSSVVSASPSASIIILVLNQLEHTRKCLESLAAHTPLPHEIIIVDNGSNDGTPEFLREWLAKTPHGTVIRNEANRGFAAGNNQGLAIARGETVVLLNNDTVVTPGWLEGMLSVLQSEPNTGVVGPMSNRVSGPQFVSEASYADLAGLPAFAEQWSQTHAGQSFEIGRAVGFCLLARREVIERVGGLDERFGSGNFEDDDFCIRARLAGFRIRIAKDVFIHHTGSQTFKGAKIDYRAAMLRNWDLFRAKWQLPTDVVLERGYPLPHQLPAGVSLNLPVAALTLTHQNTPERVWSEQASVRATTVTKTELPAAAKLGQLDEARAAFGRRELPIAWQAAIAALQARPFHPEACLLLAEIALAAGDAASAKMCAQRAADLAPRWQAAKQFLKKPLKSGTKPEWLALPGSIGNRQSAIGNRLTVGVLTKNEEQFIAQCLQSVKGLADQIVVVDTGSTDRTIEIAKSLGAEVHTTTWKGDFSAPRNLILEHATGDWILMLDADEELPADQHAAVRADMRKAEAIAFRMPLVNRGQEAEGRSFIPRLYRNAPGAYYYGRIHEQVFPSLLPLCKAFGLDTALGSACLLHHGYSKELVKDRNKIERNLHLLRLGLEERPNDVNLTLNLGLELVRSGELEAGIAKYRDAFRLMSAQKPNEVVPELREVLLTQFTSHLYKIRAHDEVVQVLTSPLAKQRDGLTASIHFALGLSSYELKQYREAAEQMRQCLAKLKQPALSPINTDILTAAPHHCLALALVKLGDALGAEKAFQAGLALTARTEDLRVDYARFLVAQKRPVEALQCLNAVVHQQATHAPAWRLGGEIALSQPEYLEFARDWTKEAIRQLPDDLVVVTQRAEALLLSQSPAEARPLWERASNCARPPRAVAAAILCATLEAQPGLQVQNASEEVNVSRAFVDWYRRLVAFQAVDAVVQLNGRVGLLRETLPGAAQVIEHVAAAAHQD